jgi:hypothetical protein
MIAGLVTRIRLLCRCCGWLTCCFWWWQVVAVFYVLLVRTTLAAAREELLRTRAFVRMIPSRILSREASLPPARSSSELLMGLS